MIYARWAEWDSTLVNQAVQKKCDIDQLYSQFCHHHWNFSFAIWLINFVSFNTSCHSWFWSLLRRLLTLSNQLQAGTGKSVSLPQWLMSLRNIASNPELQSVPPVSQFGNSSSWSIDYCETSRTEEPMIEVKYTHIFFQLQDLQSVQCSSLSFETICRHWSHWQWDIWIAPGDGPGVNKRFLASMPLLLL